jgi:hypothetical protein
VRESQIFDPDQGVQHSEALNFILRPLLERLMARLAWRHEAVTRLGLTLHLENYSVVLQPLREWDFIFSFPQTQMLSVLAILKEKLEHDQRRSPLESPVIFVEIHVLEKAPLPNRQKDFFSKKEEDLEVEASLISRLHQKIGEPHVFRACLRASYRPEHGWKKGLDPMTGPVPVPLRPLILFKKPRLLRKLGPYLICRHQKFKVVAWQGPERLSSEWWTTAFRRQYWAVTLEDGQRWWIFNAGTDLFLHGVFD